ncbi:hypothetical protein [Sphingobacterium hungaricum]|nr:hypothetical protein [Sphingobacterium hungaricum]
MDKIFLIKLFSFVLLGATFVSCNSVPTKEISATLDSIYLFQADFRTVDKKLITKELAELIDSVKTKEEQETEEMLLSEHPTDKPSIIEGDLLTSLYEGQNRYHIAELSNDADSAVLLVNFEQTGYNEKWQDTLIFKNEHGWKLDNVLYNNKYTDQYSMQNVLINYLKSE